MGVLFQARTNAGDEDIPMPRVNLMRPSARLVEIINRASPAAQMSPISRKLK
jgi:hypothetical protein